MRPGSSAERGRPKRRRAATRGRGQPKFKMLPADGEGGGKSADSTNLTRTRPERSRAGTPKGGLGLIPWPPTHCRPSAPVSVSGVAVGCHSRRPLCFGYERLKSSIILGPNFGPCSRKPLPQSLSKRPINEPELRVATARSSPKPTLWRSCPGTLWPYRKVSRPRFHGQR